jgi:hypothetical protein
MNFSFFYIGDSILPSLLIKSIRHHIPDAFIIQSTDLSTAAIDGVDKIWRYDGDISNLMTFRLESNANLNIKEQTIFLDTDMLMLKNFTLSNFVNHDVVLCEREFGLNGIVNTKYNGMNMTMYENKSFKEVWPFLGCLNITKDNSFWEGCSDILKNLDPQFHFWYGDQEAIKIFVRDNPLLNYGIAKESFFACLPEYIDLKNLPYIAHFKGKARKELMLKMANELFS